MSPSLPPPGPLLGQSDAMAAVRAFLERAAAVDVPVLIVGESGTGKSHLARLIHSRGPRREGPFVSVNCAGIPDGLFEAEFFGHRRGAFTGASESRAGLFEQASGGTLFLDEIGELPPHQQAKLLAVLEDGQVRRVGGTRLHTVDVRVVAATCRDLPAAVRSGEFRMDLYHRLALLCCEIPPLRGRPGDLDALIDHFLLEIGPRHGVSRPRLEPEGKRILRTLPWPGNIRELAHVLEAALILGGGEVVDAALLSRVLRAGGGWRAAPAGEASTAPTGEVSPSSVGRAPAPGFPPPAGGGRRYSFYGTSEEERETIRRALARHGGNRTRAARELGMSRNTLRKRMRRYGI